jgi:hypothetical protein
MELRDQTLDSFWQRPGRSAAGYRPIGAAASSQLTANLGVEVNILRAQIDRLNITSYGFLLIRVASRAVAPSPALHRVLASAVNIGSSIPFIILMVTVVPLTRWIVGTSSGTDAAIVPLILAAIPHVSRLVESALLEVDGRVIEAVMSMGTTPWQVVTKAYLPEAAPALLRWIILSQMMARKPGRFDDPSNVSPLKHRKTKGSFLAGKRADWVGWFWVEIFASVRSARTCGYARLVMSDVMNVFSTS